MKRINIEPLIESNLGIDHRARRASSFVYVESESGVFDVVAAAFVEWCDESTIIMIDIVLGDFTLEEAEKRFLVSATFSSEPRMGFSISDAAPRLKEFGRLTTHAWTREEVLCSSLKPLIFAIMDALYLQDKRVPWNASRT